jgi:hypothetical protein
MRNGWKTSEFWVTLLVVLGTLFESLAGKATGEATTICAAVAAGAYAVSRALAKRPVTPGAVTGPTTLMVESTPTTLNVEAAPTTQRHIPPVPPMVSTP